MLAVIGRSRLRRPPPPPSAARAPSCAAPASMQRRSAEPCCGDSADQHLDAGALAAAYRQHSSQPCPSSAYPRSGGGPRLPSLRVTPSNLYYHRFIHHKPCLPFASNSNVDALLLRHARLETGQHPALFFSCILASMCLRIVAQLFLQFCCADPFLFYCLCREALDLHFPCTCCCEVVAAHPHAAVRQLSTPCTSSLLHTAMNWK